MPRKRKIAVANETSPTKPLQTEVVKFSKHEIELATILEASQDNEANHEKYYKEMHKLYSKIGNDAFMETFINAVQMAMMKDETDNYGNQILKFSAKFITLCDVDEDDLTHPIIAHTFSWLLSTTSSSVHARYRICQFVNLVLNSMGPESSLDDSICEDILYYMLERMRDVALNVRYQAILALQRLQDPDNQNCKIGKAYSFHLKADPSSKVRQTVISSFGKTYQTLPLVIDRLWDTDERVRKFTILQMSTYSVKLLKVVDRLKFLEQGLNDHSENVRKAVKNVLLPQWIETYNRKYGVFIAALKIDASKEELDRFKKIAKSALHELFKKYGIVDAIEDLELHNDGNFVKCIPIEKITLEKSVLWLSIVEFVFANEEDMDMDDILPELSTMCQHIKRYLESLKPDLDRTDVMYVEYILLTLLELVALYDMGDEVGRDNLKDLLNWLLLEVHIEEGNIKLIIELYEILIPNIELRLQHFIDIINQIIELPKKHLESAKSLFEKYLEKNSNPTIKMKYSSMKVKILDLREQESNYNESNDYANVKKVCDQLNGCIDDLTNYMKSVVTIECDEKKELEDLWKQKKMNVATINKCLQISFYMVCSKKVKSLTPNASVLYKKFIRRHIESHHIKTREWAIKCCTSYSMLYDILSKDLFQELYQQFQKNYSARIWKISIECIFELLDRYGFDHFDLDDKKEKIKKSGRQLFNATETYTDDESVTSTTNVAHNDLIRLMTHLLDSCDDQPILNALHLGFCRLVLRGSYTSNNIVSKLLLKYFDPATEMETNQMLGIFFEALMRRKKQHLLEPALLPTLAIILESSLESSLAEIKPETVLRFVIDSTRAAYCNAGINIHNTLAMNFLQKMSDDKNNKELLKLLSKELLTLEFAADETLKTQMKLSIDALVTQISEPKVIKNLISCKEILDGVLRRSNVKASSVSSSKITESVVTETDWENNDEENENESRLTNSVVASSTEIADNTDLRNNTVTNESPAKSKSDSETEDDTVTPISNAENIEEENKESVEISASPESSSNEVIPATPDSTRTRRLRLNQSSAEKIAKTPHMTRTRGRPPSKKNLSQSVGKKTDNRTTKRVLNSSNNSSDSSTVNSPLRKNSRSSKNNTTSTQSPSPNKKSSGVSDTPQTPNTAFLKNIITRQPTATVTPLRMQSQSPHRTRSAIREEVKNSVILTRRALNELETSKRIPTRHVEVTSSSLLVPKDSSRRSKSDSSATENSSRRRLSLPASSGSKVTPKRSTRLAASQPTPSSEARSLRQNIRKTKQ